MSPPGRPKGTDRSAEHEGPPANAFSAEWLQLREPSDRAARDAASAAMGEDWLGPLRRVPDERPLRQDTAASLQVVDLGCGTGASLRHLAPRLGGRQHWRVFDHDEALLCAWPTAMADWARQEGHRVDSRGDPLRIEGAGFQATVERRALDLARRPDALPLGETDLLCASALLDLVSRDWLAALIGRARRTPAHLLFSLVVDGRIEWDPALAGDDDVARAFARHQGRDKGFGPALGADAPVATRELLLEAGYVVAVAHSDWRLAAGPLLAALIEGMAAAAAEQAPEAAPAFEAWRRRRAGALEGTRVCVGHVDLFARPPAAS